MKPDQPVPEAKVGEGEGERGDNVDDVSGVSTLAHCHLNMVAVSVLPPIIRSTPQKIKANSEMMMLLMTRGAHRPITPLPLLTSTALTIETFGQSSCADKERIPHRSK
jgi:hypothetical protein